MRKDIKTSLQKRLGRIDRHSADGIEYLGGSIMFGLAMLRVISAGMVRAAA